eukprot:6482667-Amphidinium_carterae.1
MVDANHAHSVLYVWKTAMTMKVEKYVCNAMDSRNSTAKFALLEVPDAFHVRYRKEQHWRQPSLHQAEVVELGDNGLALFDIHLQRRPCAQGCKAKGQGQDAHHCNSDRQEVGLGSAR